MKTLFRRQPSVFMAGALAVAFAACSGAQPPGTSNPPPTGTGGRAAGGSPPSGNGGSVTPPSNTGGAPIGTGGGGGNVNGTGGAGGSTPSDTNGPTDTPVTPPADMGPGDPEVTPPPPGACDYTPTANALSRKIKFERITLMNWPAGLGGDGRPYGSGVTEVQFVPGTQDEFFISRKFGAVHHYKLSGNTASLISTSNVDPDVDNTEDCGLIGMAFDPDFATNKFVYLAHCTTSKSSKISRYTYEANKLGSRVDILAISAPNAPHAWHSVGSIGFDKDKNLWALHGEFNTTTPAQNDGSNLGKLLRMIPGRDAAGGAKPAAGNPNNTLVYAKGLRSPWRGSYHPVKNWYFIADTGPESGDFEEISIAKGPGANFGWPGGTCNAGSLMCWSKNEVRMVMDEDNLDLRFNTRAGRSPWVGVPYANCGMDRYGGNLTGVVLAGDFFKGWVIGMVLGDDGSKVKDRSLATFATISSVVQAPDGYLYATKFGTYHQGADGESVSGQGLYRIVNE